MRNIECRLESNYLDENKTLVRTNKIEHVKTNQ